MLHVIIGAKITDLSVSYTLIFVKLFKARSDKKYIFAKIKSNDEYTRTNLSIYRKKLPAL